MEEFERGKSKIIIIQLKGVVHFKWGYDSGSK